MDVLDWLLLLGAGLLGGVINSVSSGGSFITYPALLLVGLAPIEAAATTLAALTPANLAAVPEYRDEVRSKWHLYPPMLGTVFVGCLVGVALLLSTDTDVFDALVPWLVLTATLVFAFTDRIRDWAVRSAPWLTHGRVGVLVLFVFGVYLTYFGSGIGNLMLAILSIRGFGDFLSSNAAKNVVLTMGTVIASIAYTISGFIDWWASLPVILGSAVAGFLFARQARKVPLGVLRGVVIAFGLTVAVAQFVT